MGKEYIADGFKTPSGVDLAVEALLKGGYTGNAKNLETLIIAASTGVSGVSITPTSPAPSGTGIASFTATQAGTYTNYGGVVVNANSFAIISRDAVGVYSISQTALDLTSYAKKIDIDTITLYNSFIVAGFYNNSGVASTTSSWRRVLVSRDIYQKTISYFLYGGSGANAVSFFDVNGTYISGVAMVGTNPNTGTVNIPETCRSIGVSTLQANVAQSYFNITRTIFGKINDNTVEIEKVRTDHDFTNLTDQTNFDISGFYNSSGILTASSNWISSKNSVAPNTNFTYSVNSAGGANVVSFYDINGTYISGVAGVTTGFKTGSVTTPSNAVSFGISTLVANLSTSKFGYAVNTNSLFTDFNVKITAKQDGMPKLILTVSKTLTSNGTTIFNTLAAALAAWSKLYIIHIFDGIYTENSLSVPNGCYIKGIGNVEIRGYLPVTSTTVDVDAKSTLDMFDNGTLENLTVTAKNMRYPIHSDFGIAEVVQNVINCNIIHYGNSEIYDYRVTNSIASPNDAASVWLAQSAWGCGTSSGSKIYLKNCYLKSPFRAFSTHNNTNYNMLKGASYIVANSCKFVSEGTKLDGTDLGFTIPIFVQSLGSFTDDIVELNDCTYGNYLVLESSSQDYREFTQDLKGSGNSNHLMQIRNKGGGSKNTTSQTTTQSANAFVVKLVSPNTSEVVISGNLKDAIFGNYTSLIGSAGLNSYAKAVVSSVTAFANVNAFSGTKSIIFTAGAEVKTITLSGGYANNAAMITDINTKIGAASFVSSLYWSGFDWFPNFTNEISIEKNTGTTAILRGRAVKKNGFGKIAPMTSSDVANLFYGIAVQDIPINQVGNIKVKGYLLRIWADGLFSTNLADNDNIKVNADGSFSKDTDGLGVIISKCVSNQNISINI
jgi:hypothetical protein